MQKVYGLVSDNGDGSSSVHWFKDESIVNILLGNTPNNSIVPIEDYIIDGYNMNEGSPAETFEFPDELDLVKAGFRFQELTDLC